MDFTTLKKVPIVELASLAGYTIKGNQLWSNEPHSCYIDQERNVFKWFSKDKGGSAIDFVMVLEDCSFRAACEALEGLITNGSVTLQTVVETKKITKPVVRIDKAIVQGAALQLSEKGRAYWEGRGVSEEVLDECQIGEIYRFDKQWFTFPVVDNSLQPVYLKLRICPWEESDQKGRTFPTGHHAFLFPYKSLKTRPQSLLLCEGESDTLVALSHGLQAICGTHGAGTWTETMTEHISRSYPKHVIVAYDRDEAGQKGAAKVIASLRVAGIACTNFVVPEPYKDVAEFLVEQPEQAPSLSHSPVTHVDTSC